MCCAVFVPKEDHKDEIYYKIPYTKILIMGILEFLGCVFSVVGLNCAGSGIYQVIYASIVIWIALMSKWFLKKQLSAHQWTAVIITSFGVSLSAIGSVSSPGGLSVVRLLGILVTLMSTFTYGSNYIISEQVLSSPSPPSGGTVQVYTGLTGFGLVFAYIFFYTIPNWEILVSVHVKESHGSVFIIIFTYMGLVLSAFLHSWSYYKLVKQTGSVSTGILQSLRAIFVFILSSLFYCNNHPEQCLNRPKIASVFVVVFGVLYFTFLQRTELSSKSNLKNKIEIV